MSDSNVISLPAAIARLVVFVAVVAAAAVGAYVYMVEPKPAPMPPEERLMAQEEAHRATGGAQTLEDILARQQGKKVGDDYLRAQIGRETPEEAFRGQLGTLGLASDSDLYRAMRYNSGDFTVSIPDKKAAIMMQDAGMWWLELRDGPLKTYGAWLLGGMVVVLALFYLLRGKIRIEHGRSGRLIERFDGLERFGHWLLASSFIILAITGLALLFGREYLIPLIGKEGFATIALAGKWVHNNVAWAFMLALVLVFVLWLFRNIPNLDDLRWLAVGGGLFSKGLHPPSRKFNAGQKIIFWIVILLGASVSVSGLSLIFPFELPLFAKTFAVLNDLGFAAVWGAPLPTELTPHEEMQYAQLWHSIIAFVMIAIILAHIYLGSIGMEGAFDAMGTGMVDRNWALEHHSLWVEEVEDREADASGHAATPAE